MSEESRASDASVLAYFQEQQCSAQWRTFLSVLGQQLCTVVGAEEVAALMFRVGKEMAQQLSLPDATSMADIATHMNSHWAAMQFGWMELSDEGRHLEIKHHCAPLVAAFGPESKSWCAALLEGVYSQWFKDAGAGDELALRLVQLESNLAQTLEFRLAHPAQFS